MDLMSQAHPIITAMSFVGIEQVQVDGNHQVVQCSPRDAEGGNIEFLMPGYGSHPGHPDRIELGSAPRPAEVSAAAPRGLLRRVIQEPRRAVPTIAKEPESCEAIAQAVKSLSSAHVLNLGDSRRLELTPDSVELVVTSPPYWTLKEYNVQAGQLAQVEDYEEFLDGLDEVWRHAHRALVPGGRMVVVVGDVNVARKSFGRHLVFPLHASIQERCRLIGFDNLAPIIWHKIANAKYEMGGGGFYGKPYEPNGVIKNDVEYILLQRKRLRG